MFSTDTRIQEKCPIQPRTTDMQTYNKIMEIIYLVAGIITLILVTYHVIENGNDELYYYIFPAILLGMYGMRVFMRRRMEKLIEYKRNEQRNKGKD